MRSILVSLAVLLLAPPALAEDLGKEEGGRLFAIEVKKFKPAHEFHLGAGWLPQDAFWKGVTGEFSYRYHFNDFFALEALRFTYSRNYDTDLKKELLTEFPAPLEADPFEEVTYMATINAIVKPFYGKSAFFNRKVLRQELYFMAGGGAIAWQQGRGPSRQPTGTRPTFNFGIGLRYWLTKRVSVRLEALENIHMETDGTTDDMIYVNFAVTIATLKKD